MILPFFYKSLGAIHKHTLDNWLMDNYTLVLDFFSPAPSLDLFAHATTRTTVSNQFVPELDWPQPRPTTTTTDPPHIVLHQPISRQGGGLLDELQHDTFGVILVDPPYTPLQQKALYRHRTRSRRPSPSARSVPSALDTLLVATDEQIERLYQLSWNYAVHHSQSAIVLYGYKLGVPTRGWRRAALWAIGGGSHPAIVATLFLHRTVTPEAEHILVQQLHQHARDSSAEVTQIEVLDQPPTTRTPPDYHVGDRIPSTIALVDDSTRYKQVRHNRDPKHFPQYLAQSMYELSHSTKKLAIHTRMAALYQHIRGPQHQQLPCFTEGVARRQVYTPHPWSNLIFVLHTRT